MEYDLILTNGIIVTIEGMRRADVAVQGEKIVANGSPRERRASGFLRVLCAFRYDSQRRPRSNHGDTENYRKLRALRVSVVLQGKLITAVMFQRRRGSGSFNRTITV